MQLSEGPLLAKTAVLLDFGGVLVLPSVEPVRLALSELDKVLTDEKLERAFYSGIAALDSLGRPFTSEDASVRTYVDGFLDALGLGHVSTALRRGVEAAFLGTEVPWSKVVPGSVRAMRELRNLGHPLAVVSNSRGRVEARLRELAICQVGDGAAVEVAAIVDSHKVGVRKPGARIFHIALTQMDSGAGRAVHVGDSVVYDVRGAEAADLRPVHFDPWAMCVEKSHEHIRTLWDLIPIL